MTSPFLRDFGNELAAAADREVARRRRQRRVRGAVAGAVAAVAAALGVVALPNPASADVSVVVVDGYVELTLDGPVSSTGEVLRALREHGISTSVSSVPTGPSGVGLIARVLVEPGAGPVQTELTGPRGTAYSGFRVPEQFAGDVEVVLGRAAAAGEDYAAFTDPFAEGEPLDCAGVLGERLDDVVGALDGLEVSIRFGPPEALRIEPLDQAIRSGAGKDFVVGGMAGSPTRVELFVAPEPVEGERGC